MYLPAEASESLYQGDIIDGCPYFTQEVGQTNVDLLTEPTRWESRIIILTQSCDLAQAKRTRVVIAPIRSAQHLIDQGLVKASTVRDQIRRGQVFGWYFLPAAAPPIELPESLVDLLQLHTVPRQVLEQLVAAGQRVCRVTSPYREHLAQHFAVTYMRIGLPEPYPTEP